MLKAHIVPLVALLLAGCGSSQGPSQVAPSGKDTRSITVKGYYFGKHYETAVPKDCKDPIGRGIVGTSFSIRQMLDGGRQEGDVLATGTFMDPPVLGEYKGRAACVLTADPLTVSDVDLYSIGTRQISVFIRRADLDTSEGVAWLSYQP